MDKTYLKKQMDDRDHVTDILDRQSLGEEIANSITHGIGVLSSVAALVLLLVYSVHSGGDAWKIVSFSVYGATLIFLYIVSTLYHSLNSGDVKKFLRKLDHAAILFLIAGTYTPVALILLRHSWVGWAFFGAIWLTATAGIICNFMFFGKYRPFSVFIYLTMGWLAITVYKPIAAAAPIGFAMWLITGGILYTLSIPFYRWRKLRYHHVIFHILILAGSASHFFGFLKYLT